jgi:phosphoesterase RecJ-like protein
MKALALALRQLGKHVRLVTPSFLPSRYDFLDPQKEITRFQPPGNEYSDIDGLVILDTGTWNQLAEMAEFVRGLWVEKVVIDHHVTQEDLGARRFVDTTAEATGRLVHEAIRALGVPLVPESASALFVAVAMDTGWFHHSNTSAASLTLAAELVAAGARPEHLYQQLYDRNSLGRMKLTGLVLDRLTLHHGGRLATSRILRTDYEATGSKPPDTEDLVNYTLSVVGVEVGVLFMEQPRGGVKVSFRSRGAVNVAQVAQTLGGGGHAAASGAVIDAPMAEVQSRVVAALTAALGPNQ